MASRVSSSSEPPVDHRLAEDSDQQRQRFDGADQPPGAGPPYGGGVGGASAGIGAGTALTSPPEEAVAETEAPVLLEPAPAAEDAAT